MTTASSTGRSGSRDVLLVEDNPGDKRLVQVAFEEGSIDATLHAVPDGDEMMDFLFRRGDHQSAPFPDLVLLDLNLPKTHGTELLEWVRTDPELRHLPVVILTSSADRDDVEACYRNHANAYLTKPTNHDEFVTIVESLEDFWLDRVQLPPRP
jgi:two-component system response regulator